MRKEDWISTKERLPEDSKGKRYLIHIIKTGEVQVVGYNHEKHDFYCIEIRLKDRYYTVDQVDFWAEIKDPGEEQESMYRFHEGMVIKDWNNHIYVVMRVNERSYEARIYGDPEPSHVLIPLAMQGKYTIIKEKDLDELKPMFNVNTQIRRISDRKVYTIEYIINDKNSKYYGVVDENGNRDEIFFGEQKDFVQHYNFEDGDTVRKIKGNTNTLYILRKNKPEEHVNPVNTPLMTTFYESMRKLDFSLMRVDQETSTFADMQITYRELEDYYEIVQKHDDPLDIKQYS